MCRSAVFDVVYLMFHTILRNAQHSCEQRERDNLEHWRALEKYEIARNVHQHNFVLRIDLKVNTHDIHCSITRNPIWSLANGMRNMSHDVFYDLMAKLHTFCDSSMSSAFYDKSLTNSTC